MSANGNWTQLLTLGAVVLGGLITMSTTWLANSQQSANQARERREDRLMPLYLNLHLAIRDLVKLLQDYALADFPEDSFTDTDIRIKSAYEVVYQIGYKIDFMSPPKIAFHNELVEDSLTRLIERLGFRLRLASIPALPEARSQDYVRSELRAISELRMGLLKEMQDDLALTSRQSRLWQSFRSAILRLRRRTTDEASEYNSVTRDQDGFLINDGRYG